MEYDRETTFHYGKFRGVKYREALNGVSCVGLKEDYVVWFFNDNSYREVEEAPADLLWLLEQVGAHVEFTETEEHFNNTFVAFTAERWGEILRDREREELLAKGSGHHYADGDRVELKLRQIGEFGFDGMYGWCNVITYVSEDGKVFKYMGSASPDVDDEEFTTVKATIKHDHYDGQDETKLKRINISK